MIASKSRANKYFTLSKWRCIVCVCYDKYPTGGHQRPFLQWSQRSQSHLSLPHLFRDIPFLLVLLSEFTLEVGDFHALGSDHDHAHHHGRNARHKHDNRPCLIELNGWIFDATASFSAALQILMSEQKIPLSTITDAHLQKSAKLFLPRFTTHNARSWVRFIASMTCMQLSAYLAADRPTPWSTHTEVSYIE